VEGDVDGDHRRRAPVRQVIRAIAILGAALISATSADAQAPRRDVRALAAADSELVAIAIGAARSIDNNGAAPAQFAGVFIASREVRGATDQVINATKLVKVSGGPGKVPYVIARAGEPCPECEAARAAETYTFTMFRATPDSAFVGMEVASGDRPTQMRCVALIRAGQRVAGDRDVENQERKSLWRIGVIPSAARELHMQIPRCARDDNQ
jgi:hypothetical protein